MLLTFARVFKDKFKEYPYYFNYFNTIDELKNYHFNILLIGRRDYQYNENILDKNKLDDAIFLFLDTIEYGGLSRPVKYYKVLYKEKLLYTESTYFEEL